MSAMHIRTIGVKEFFTDNQWERIIYFSMSYHKSGVKLGDLAEYTDTIGCECKTLLHSQCISLFILYGNICIL